MYSTLHRLLLLTLSHQTIWTLLEAQTNRKSLGDRALSVWQFDLAKGKVFEVDDFSALMLLTSSRHRTALQELAIQAGKPLCHYLGQKEQCHLVSATLLQLSDSKACIDTLTKTQRASEAASFA